MFYIPFDFYQELKYEVDLNGIKTSKKFLEEKLNILIILRL